MLQRRRILKTYLGTVNNINEIFVRTAQKIAFYGFYAHFVVNVVKVVVNNCAFHRESLIISVSFSSQGNLTFRLPIYLLNVTAYN